MPKFLRLPDGTLQPIPDTASAIPQPTPEQLAGEQEQPEENAPGWEWIGSDDRPEAQTEDDGISDLFRVTDDDVGASDEDLSDLTDVDIERDVLDADEDGTLDDLLDVTEADIMGDELGQRPSRPASQRPKIRRRITPRYQPPTSMGRSG